MEGRTEWREGAFFFKNGARALIRESSTNKEGLKIIDIRLQGVPNARKEFLILSCTEIKKIQDNSFPNLPYAEMVPCLCQERADLDAPEFYEYAALENLLSKKKGRAQCHQSGDMLDIVTLIDAVGVKIVEMEKKLGKEFMGNHIDFRPTLHVECGSKLYMPLQRSMQNSTNPRR